MSVTKWAVLGTASVAETVVEAIAASPGNEVRAVASRDPSRARSWADEMGIPAAYGSYDEMLAAGGFDMVYNPLPNSLHAHWTIKAMEAGYPVLCEKPFAMSASQAREVMAVSEKTGKLVAEAFMYRYHPQFDRALELLDEGIIGSLVSIDSSFCFYNDDPASIVASSDMGGGALMDVGCYCVNFARLVARSEPLRAEAVQVGDRMDHTLAGLLEFPDGVVARFETSIASAERHHAQIHGTEGSIALPYPWVPGPGPTRMLVKRWGEPDELVPIPGADTYQLEVEDFARAVATGTPLRWPVQDAVANMMVIDALFESARRSYNPIVK